MIVKGEEIYGIENYELKDDENLDEVMKHPEFSKSFTKKVMVFFLVDVDNRYSIPTGYQAISSYEGYDKSTFCFDHIVKVVERVNSVEGASVLGNSFLIFSS